MNKLIQPILVETAVLENGLKTTQIPKLATVQTKFRTKIDKSIPRMPTSMKGITIQVSKNNISLQIWLLIPSTNL